MSHEVGLATDLLDELFHEAEVVPAQGLDQLRDVEEDGVGGIRTQTPGKDETCFDSI